MIQAYEGLRVKVVQGPIILTRLLVYKIATRSTAIESQTGVSQSAARRDSQAN
jgi:hypothetical protein